MALAGEQFVVGQARRLVAEHEGDRPARCIAERGRGGLAHGQVLGTPLAHPRRQRIGGYAIADRLGQRVEHARSGKHIVGAAR